MSSDETHFSRNHTARIGRLIEAVDDIYQRQMKLQKLIADQYEPDANPMVRVHQLFAQYQLETGEEVHPLIYEALELLGDKYNGFLDNVVAYAPSLASATIIAEERVRWQTTKKRNEYMMHAQRRRRAKTSGQREVYEDDAKEFERHIQHQQQTEESEEPKPWSDEEMARGEHLVKRSDKVWLDAVKREEEKECRATEIEPNPTVVERSKDEVDEEVDEGRLQYERERAERQRKEAEHLANRSGNPVVSSIKS